MIQDWFCDIYSSIRNTGDWKEKCKLNSLRRVVTRFCANLMIPPVFLLTADKEEYRLSPTQRKTPVIVSLTSFPARINRLWLVVACLLRQTVKPDKIILWLSSEQYASLDLLPQTLLKQQQYGLEIRLCPGDLLSHKKYQYVLKEYPSAILVTIDDDIFYRSTLIEDLLVQHEQYPHAIIADYTHNMRFNHHGELLPYNQWENNVTVGDSLFFGSGGGTLFPPHSLHPTTTDSQTAMQLCPMADDIWLNAMARLQGTSVIHTQHYGIILPIQNRAATTLARYNVSIGNDLQLRQITEYCLHTYDKNPFAHDSAPCA